MKKFSSLLFLLLLLQQTQSQVNFTVTLVSPGASITCTQPFVTYGTSSNFGSVLSYSWANASALFTGPVAAFNIPGIYSVTASSGTLISNTQTISVGINTTAPQVYLTPPQLTISCLSSPASVSVMAMPINNIKHSIVSPYGGTLSLNNFSIAYLPGGPGSYTSVVTDLSNGCTTFTHFTVGASSTYPDFKVLSVQNFSLGCGTKSIAVVTATSLNSNLSYTLQGPGTPGSGSTYSFTQAGTWTLAATDNTSQCALQIPVQIVQNTQPPLIYADVALQVLSCQHKSVQVDGISFNSSVSFSWLYAGTPGVAPSPMLVLANTLVPTATLINTFTLLAVDNGNNCISKMIVPIYQNLFPPKAMIGGAVNALTCFTPTLLLNALGQTGIPANSPFAQGQPVVAKNWYGPLPQVSPSVVTNTYLAATPGVYTLEVTDSNNGCTSTTTTVIQDNRVYPSIIGPPMPIYICPSGTVAVSPIIMGNPATLTYSWTSPAGAVVSGAQTATLITNAPGIYTVAATSTISGCTASASAYVYECVGLEDNNAAPALRLFPNPVKDQLHFVNPVQSACKLSFSNTLGQVVHTLLLPQLPAQLSVEFLNAGVYYLECTSSSGSSVLKFYKE